MAEVGVIGNDGVFGIPVLLGARTTMGRAVIQAGGHAYKLKAEDLRSAFSNGGRLQSTSRGASTAMQMAAINARPFEFL